MDCCYLFVCLGILSFVILICKKHTLILLYYLRVGLFTASEQRAAVSCDSVKGYKLLRIIVLLLSMNVLALLLVLSLR